MPPVHTGESSAAHLSVAIVAARFNDFIVASLLRGAVEAWERHGGAPDRLVIARVPGAFELPVAARQCAASGRFAAVVALGCVIRGDTAHFDFVAGECARGLSQVALDTGVPVMFGVLTVENVEQAVQRAAVRAGNKGGEAMSGAIEMANLLPRLS
ncbi:MAG: 6,7-dimethyl-8-ribityllumazine synthase [Steroidobacteraceae bacterium]